MGLKIKYYLKWILPKPKVVPAQNVVSKLLLLKMVLPTQVAGCTNSIAETAIGAADR